MPLGIRTEDFLANEFRDSNFVTFVYDYIETRWYGVRQDGGFSAVWFHSPDIQDKNHPDYAPPNGHTRLKNWHTYTIGQRSDLRRGWAIGWLHDHTGANMPTPWPEGTHGHLAPDMTGPGLAYDDLASFGIPQQNDPRPPPAPQPVPAFTIDWVAAPGVNEVTMTLKKKKEDVFEGYKSPDFEKSSKLPRFRQKYETEDEARLRLNESIITVMDKAQYIHGVLTNPKTRELWINCSDGIGAKFIHVKLNDTGCDLRTLECGYMNYGDNTYYLYRKPSRVYKQGINHQNSRIIPVGAKSGMHDGRMPNNLDFVRAYNSFELRRYDPKLASERPFAFSHDIATYPTVSRKGDITITVEYKCRKLGVMNDENRLYLFKNLANVPWIVDALREVGIDYGVIDNDD